MKHNVFLQLGSNLNNPMEQLSLAKIQISEQIAPIHAQSSIYQTQAWGYTNQPPFLNQIIVVKTHLKPQTILQRVLKIEQEMGRIRNQHWAERVIDIDILYYENSIVSEQKLHIPHPQIQNRRFVLEPLTEIAPDFIHPILKQSNRMLLEKCEDKGWVKFYSN